MLTTAGFTASTTLAKPSGQAVAAATLGVLTLAGLASVPAILLLTLTAGAIRGVEQAARQSYTYDVAGPAELMNGLALLGVSMRVGWLAGSLAIGAVIAHFGSGTAYLVVAAGYLAGAIPFLRASAPPAVARAATLRHRCLRLCHHLFQRLRLIWNEIRAPI